MAKFKVTIREKEKRLDGTVNVKIRVTHNRKFRDISTDYHVLPEYFDKKNGKILKGGGRTQDDADRHNTRIQIQLGVMATKSENQKGVRHMDIGSLMTVLRGKRAEYEVYSALDTRIEQLKKAGNINYADTIKRTKNTVEKFAGEGLLPFEAIDYAWLVRFEGWMRQNGLGSNTIGIYMRDLRTVYNQAITNGITELSSYPFRKYRIPKEATRKRNLPAEEIAKLYRADLKKPSMIWARDIWMLCFFLIGINLVDLAKLKKVEDGRIYYKRSKGKKQYSIKVWPEAQEIIDKYAGKEYLVNILDNYTDYRSATNLLDARLKDITKLIGIDKKISQYWCRHSWSTVARSIGISRDDIRYGLGHNTNTISDIYIEDDQELVDKANRKIIDHIISMPLSE